MRNMRGIHQEGGEGGVRAATAKAETCGNCWHHRTDGVSGMKYCGNTGSPTNGMVTGARAGCGKHEGKDERKWKAVR